MQITVKYQPTYKRFKSELGQLVCAHDEVDFSSPEIDRATGTVLWQGGVFCFGCNNTELTDDEAEGLLGW